MYENTSRLHFKMCWRRTLMSGKNALLRCFMRASFQNGGKSSWKMESDNTPVSNCHFGSFKYTQDCPIKSHKSHSDQTITLLWPLPLVGLFVQIPIRTLQRLPILISHNPTSARVLHCVLTALPCMNWFSQASLAPIRPLMEQGHWANHSSRLFRRLGAMRKICRGLTQQQQHANPQRPQVATRRRISRLWGCIFSEWSQLLRLLASTQGVIQTVSIFHWGATLLPFLWCAVEGLLNKYWWLLLLAKYFGYAAEFDLI